MGELPDRFLIRAATLADLDDVAALVSAYRAFYQQPPDAQRERAFVERHLRDNTSDVYVAQAPGGGVAGFVQLFRTYSTVHLACAWILEDLYVHAQYRGRGAASALLERALLHARQTGASGMFLETAVDNTAAQRVYERAGWSREGRFLKYNAPLAP